MLKNHLKIGLFVMGISMMNVTIYATDVVPIRSEIIDPIKSNIIDFKTEDKEVAEDDYVRITQPLAKEEVESAEASTLALSEVDTIEIDMDEEEEDLALDNKIQTFDSEMNIMGEASMGTEITIVVYYGEALEELVELTQKEVYELKTVGATETFNQLITLREGLNDVIIHYYFGETKEEGSIRILIERIGEEDKETIKSYVEPKALTEKMTTR